MARDAVRKGFNMKWLLLRGLARDVRHWGDFPQVFERHVEDSEAHVLDLPGFGSERDRKSPLSVRGMTDDLRERWQDLKGEQGEPWGILGISLGGMIVMDWVSRFPADFTSAVIINSSSRDTSPAYRRLQPYALRQFIKVARAKTNQDKENYILHLNSNTTITKKPELVEQWAQMADEQPNPAKNNLIQLNAAVRFNAPRSLSTRTLFISSLADRLSHPRCTWELAHRFKAPVVFHDTAGHDLPLDAPDWVASQVQSWISAPPSV